MQLPASEVTPSSKGFFDGTATRVLKMSPTGQLLTPLAMSGSDSGQLTVPVA